MYEAVCLIVISGLLGTLVGIVVAITLTLQMLMFVELPFVFAFPTAMFLLTFLGGLATAAFGSYFAIREVRGRSIATILKGLL
jgi:ABC-type antimicrobial peptide transport system permease subunit